jgi:hypothetical protein
MVSITDDRDLRRGARLIVAAFAVRPLMSQLGVRRAKAALSSGCKSQEQPARLQI